MIQEHQTNLFSLIDVIEQVNIPAVPPGGQNFALPMPFELVTLWSRGANDQPTSGRARVVVIGVSGVRTELPPYNIDLVTYGRLRNRSKFPGIQLENFGRVEFVVELQNSDDDGWTRVATIPIQIARSTSQSPQYN